VHGDEHCNDEHDNGGEREERARSPTSPREASLELWDSVAVPRVAEDRSTELVEGRSSRHGRDYSRVDGIDSPNLC
jgi:hypothetical protein